jgi:hypothetical protein
MYNCIPMETGKYKYKRLSLGIKIAWFLMFFKMSCLSLFKIWKTLRQPPYLDDLLILTNNIDQLQRPSIYVKMVLARFSTSGMRMNISKSKFLAEQLEYLGYWITRQGIQPIRNNVESIINIEAPKTRKQEPTTTVYWYSQLLSQHVVSQKSASSQVPLTSLTASKINFECHSSHQRAFDKIKKL